MGVQGLATLLENYGQIYREVQFRKSRLVIDGCNLLYLMYFSSGLDENHGGEYAAFEEQIEKFVSALRDCGISPYVVLDGGTDSTDKKLDTLLERAESRIKKAHQAAVEGRKQHILPLLTKMVFKQTLARLEVPVAQCYGEADQQIAALANEWKCPVLSNDSDFYIFDLPAGLLPISHFKWEAVEQSGSQRYIPCKSYKTSSFCIVFNVQPELLPTLAALAGNDYVKLKRMETPINWAQFATAGSETQSRLEGLLCWLKGFTTPEEALEAAVGLMGELNTKRKAEVKNSLNLGMEEYKLPPSYLSRFFIHGIAPPLPVVEKVFCAVLLQVAVPIPDWIQLPLMQARLTADVLDVLQLQRMSLSVCVDHKDTPTANLTSRPLRQVMYGLLLGGGTALQVEERDREGLQMKFNLVPPVFRGVTQRLVLNSLNKAELSERLQLLLDTLQVTEACLSRLPPQLRLPVAVICFWLQNARPRPDEKLLKALLLGLSVGDPLRHTAALQTEDHRCKRHLDLTVVHAFNQWQVCMKDSIHLNQLLGFPLPEPQVSRLYQGVLVHELVHRMRTTGRLKVFLKSDRSSVRQYRTMVTVVHQFLAQRVSTPSESHNEVAAPRQRRPLDDLTVNLQQLFLQYDDEEAATEINSAVRVQQELHLDKLVSVKTRYRTKERNNRSHNLELARKEESRGWDLL
ncbi:protein asteroid homolog 1-like isoform X1 [Seriola lalandi dorsalis]|uniref:protein asteroid homolog 1-like isoform X1 n=1 Tax=Seriola lalandi dorsalis TaxID=1841481 RepID=UPI000C6F6B55|nr:protein asteroid homolog 1-like isoform X1 [Seriola lalandi dorsalis]